MSFSFSSGPELYAGLDMDDSGQVPKEQEEQEEQEAEQLPDTQVVLKKNFVI